MADSGTTTQSGEASKLKSGGSGDGRVMTIVEHLEELRWRMVRCIVFFACSFLITLFFAKRIIHALEGPAGPMQFQALSIEEPLLVYFKVTFYTALVVSCPYILWEAARFVAPGLKPREKQVLTPLVIGAPLLFALGTAFAYFGVLPPMLHFFGKFGRGLAPINQRLDFYISLVSSIMLYMGLCFQLPMVLFALSFTGLVNSKALLKAWKYAVFAAAAVSAVITPDPTALSMIVVLSALIALYFVSVALLKIAGQ